MGSIFSGSVPISLTLIRSEVFTTLLISSYQDLDDDLMYEKSLDQSQAENSALIFKQHGNISAADLQHSGPGVNYTSLKCYVENSSWTMFSTEQQVKKWKNRFLTTISGSRKGEPGGCTVIENDLSICHYLKETPIQQSLHRMNDYPRIAGCGGWGIEG